MRMIWAGVLMLWSSGATAQGINATIDAANASFDRMPTVTTVSTIGNTCGAGNGVNSQVVYCTTENTIFITNAAAAAPEGPYLLAHVYGHAVQVRHGVADVALRTITANRDREAELRMDVTRMVECIAGVILSGAATPQDLNALFTSEPFTGSHWGRSPLVQGPRVRLMLAERNRWLQKGFAAGEPSVCHTASFPADLVVTAFRR